MVMGCHHRAFRFVCLGILLVLLGSSASVCANPIPIEPHPPTNLPGIIHSREGTVGWIIAIFVIDFFLDTLLVYGGVLVLGRLRLLSPQQVFAMPKTTFFSGVLLISFVGFSAEWVLGVMFWGLFVTLWVVLFSFCVVSRYLYKFTWSNALYFGGFASLINLLVWVVLFNI
jgi:hypothetical protein